jgi:hypothetical protein
MLKRHILLLRCAVLNAEGPVAYCWRRKRRHECLQLLSWGLQKPHISARSVLDSYITIKHIFFAPYQSPDRLRPFLKYPCFEIWFLKRNPVVYVVPEYRLIRFIFPFAFNISLPELVMKYTHTTLRSGLCALKVHFLQSALLVIRFRNRIRWRKRSLCQDIWATSFQQDVHSPSIHLQSLRSLFPENRERKWGRTEGLQIPQQSTRLRDGWYCLLRERKTKIKRICESHSSRDQPCANSDLHLSLHSLSGCVWSIRTTTWHMDRWAG